MCPGSNPSETVGGGPANDISVFEFRVSSANVGLMLGEARRRWANIKKVRVKWEVGEARRRWANIKKRSGQMESTWSL